MLQVIEASASRRQGVSIDQGIAQAACRTKRAAHC